MHLYKVKNTGAAGYVLTDAYGRPTRVPPGDKVVEVALGDDNAVAARQTELRGGGLKIEPTGAEGKKVLSGVELKPGRRFRLVEASAGADPDRAPPRPHKSQERLAREAARAASEKAAESRKLNSSRVGKPGQVPTTPNPARRPKRDLEDLPAVLRPSSRSDRTSA